MVKVALLAGVVLAAGTVVNAQGVPSQPPARAESAQPRSHLLCGTRVFRADPAIDPKIAKPAPEGTFTLRAVQPPVCRDTFASSTSELKQRLPQIFGPKR